MRLAEEHARRSHDLERDAGGKPLHTFPHPALEKRFDDLAAKIDDLLLRVKNIESQPLPLPLAGARGAVSKSAGRRPADEDTLEKLLADPDQLALLAIKLAQRNGRNVFPR